MTYKWSRSEGYECSSYGDKRFSAFYARMPDGRSIEQHYQCDIKGYDPGGTNWRLGKGEKGLDPNKNLWKEYLNLWEIWAKSHENDLIDLAEKAKQYNGYLSDKFATNDINQAHALAVILNKS